MSSIRAVGDNGDAHSSIKFGASGTSNLAVADAEGSIPESSWGALDGHALHTVPSPSRLAGRDRGAHSVEVVFACRTGADSVVADHSSWAGDGTLGAVPLLSGGTLADVEVTDPHHTAATGNAGLSIPVGTLGTSNTSSPVPVLTQTTAAIVQGSIPFPTSIARLAYKTVPVLVCGTSALLDGGVPRLAVLAVDAGVSVPVETLRTDALQRLCVPDLSVAAGHTIVAVPVG